MKPLEHAFCTCLLASAAAAQISPNDVVLAVDSGYTASEGLTLVNYSTGKARLVGNNTEFRHTTVALDPDRLTEMWGISKRLVIGHREPIDHYILKGENISGSGTGSGVLPATIGGKPTRFHIYNGDLLVLVTSGSTSVEGLWIRSRNGLTHTLAGAIPKPMDIAVLADKAYVTTLDPTNNTSALYQVDLAAKPMKTAKITLKMDPKAPTGAKLPKSFVTICAKGPDAVADTLMLVDTTGVIYEVKPGQPLWNITTTTAKGVAAPVAIAWHPDPTVRLIVATGTKVYDQANYLLPVALGKPIHTSTYPILDMAMDLGNVSPIGTACKGSNGKSPDMIYGGSPYQGNKNFTVRMQDGLPNAKVYFVVGLTKNIVDLTVIGATGCTLNTDILINFVFGLDGTGAITIPAPVPVASSLQGLKLFVQFGCQDAKANATGLTTTEAFKLRIR